MNTLFRELRSAVLMALRRPWAIGIIIVVLGLGVGVNTTVFNLVNAMMLRPLPYQDADRIVALHESQHTKGTSGNPVSALNLEDWTEGTRAFQAVAAFQRTTFNLSTDDEPERVHGTRVGARLFGLLGVSPILGRGFDVAEEVAGRDRVAILTHATWQRRFSGDRGVLGRIVRLDGDAYEIVGIMPAGFEFPEWCQIYTPLVVDPATARRDDRSLDALARLAPGATLAQAQQQLDGVAAELQTRYPSTNTDRGVRARLLREELMPQEPQLGLLLLLGAGIFLQLIVCSNLAILMMAVASSRNKEMAVRMALGAEKGHIVRQLLAESLVIAAAGSAVGILVSLVGVRLMLGAVQIPIPFWIHFDLDGRVLAFTVLLAVGSSILFGLAPALRAPRLDIVTTLKDESRGASSSRTASRVRNGLVAAQFALCLALLVGAMLMVRGFYRLQQADRGFDVHRSLVLRFSMAGTRYGDDQGRVAFTRLVLERLRALQGVTGAGLVSHLPISRDGFDRAAVVADGAAPRPGEEPLVTRHAASDGYLEAAGIAVLEGRSFTADDVAEASPVALVSQRLAQRLWPAGGALGRRLRETDSGEWLTVVGVTRDVSQVYRMGGVDTWPDAQLYLPLTRSRARSLSVAVRTAGEPGHKIRDARAAVAAVDRGLPLFNVMTMDEAVARIEWLPRFWGNMFGALSLIALVVAAIAVYGVTAYVVGQKTRDLAIRLALGATPTLLLKQVVGQSLKVAAVGMGVGVLLALVVAHSMSSVLQGVSAVDPLVYIGVSFVLFVVAVAASGLPARRVLRVNPATTLHGG